MGSTREKTLTGNTSRCENSKTPLSESTSFTCTIRRALYKVAKALKHSILISHENNTTFERNVYSKSGTPLKQSPIRTRSFQTAMQFLVPMMVHRCPYPSTQSQALQTGGFAEYTVRASYLLETQSRPGEEPQEQGAFEQLRGHLH
jgi:hypothetical protein